MANLDVSKQKNVLEAKIQHIFNRFKMSDFLSLSLSLFSFSKVVSLLT